jgi:BirA family biotin operon repressor/biotin-[acetyl-CoA-carboxylase] ligase
MTNTQSLVEILSDGTFHSGESLGRQLGISRAAVWKHIQQLAACGLQVHAISGKGYRLVDDVSLLQLEAINAAMTDAGRAAIGPVSILERTASTNETLEKSRDYSDDRIHVCLAEYQTAGKGRRGRNWQTPYAGSISMSVSWNFPQGSALLRGYSLAAGVCVARALHDYGISGIGLKWPNDIFWHDQKLGGILIEITGEADGTCQVITGIGINVNLPREFRQFIEQPCVGLADISDSTIDRNVLVARILERMLELKASFPSQGLAAYLDDWHSLDICRDRQVDIHLSNNIISGLAAGINDEGQFLLLTNDGVCKYDIGDVSLRVATRNG